MEIAVFGYGNIGSGVVQVVEKNQEQIARGTGCEVHVKYVLDLREFENDPIHDRVVHDVSTIINDREIKVVCETMGGVNPAYEFSRKALEAGKSVCTSNKELVAAHGAELIRIAKEHNCNYFFEASVGGGIPIIRTINGALRQEKILNISGIVNGTTNYILTKMEREGADFDAVLKEAQEKGYAERNPEADIEGHDACRKIAILSSLMTGKTVDYRDISTEGITQIRPEDFRYAHALGKTIKLLVVSKAEESGCMAIVSPHMIDKEHPLAAVNDVFNAVFVKGNMLDDSMYYGRGAGKLPTASAVVADVMEAICEQGRHLDVNWSEEKFGLLDQGEVSRRFFIRLKKTECSREEAEEIFGKGEAVGLPELPDEFGFVTSFMKEKEFEKKRSLAKGIINRIRIED